MNTNPVTTFKSEDLRPRSTSGIILGFLLLALTGFPLLADSPPKPAELISEALPILLKSYPHYSALAVKEGDTLGEIISRSHGEISLKPPPPDLVSSPILATSLPGDTIYWRLASFVPKTSWSDLEVDLAQAKQGIILDLRANAVPDDFQGATSILNLFAVSDTTLSKFKAPNSASPPNPGADHLFHEPIIVLINGQTTGAAEALAACLKADGALVIGRKSQGSGAVFEQHVLSSGQVLRYLSDEVTLADGTTLWGHPVLPDIEVPVNDQMEKTALVLIEKEGPLEVVGESAQRHRLNEATLVQGQDPDFDAYVAEHEKKPDSPAPNLTPVVRDIVLIHALDSLKAIQISQKPTSPAPISDVLPVTTSTVR